MNERSEGGAEARPSASDRRSRRHFHDGNVNARAVKWYTESEYDGFKGRVNVTVLFARRRNLKYGYRGEGVLAGRRAL